ncbi:MAG TPA: phage major capsid protein [Candidatus Limnocylindrales bacterium]|nr:phage major capsid protein [Candidatus Limnocylindrales bacterium]
MNPEIPYLRYAGAVPGAAAVYTPGNVFGGGSIVQSIGNVAFMLGVAHLFTLEALEGLRGRDAYASYKAEAVNRRTELDKEFEGQPMSAEAREEFGTLNKIIEKADAVIEELDARTAIVTQGGDDPRRSEPAAPVRSRMAHLSRIPENIHDVADYRNYARSLDDLPVLYREGAKRFLDGLDKDTAQALDAMLGKVVERKNERGFLAMRYLECGSPLYDRAFGKYIMGQGLTVQEQAALGTYSNSGADGGYAVPVILDPTLVPTSDLEISDIRRIARVIPIVGKEWDGVTSGGITASRVGEASAITATSPTLAQPRIVPTAVKVAIKLSLEVDADWGSLRTEMAREINDAKINEEATTFTTGSGDGATGPQGIERMADSSIIWTQASASFGVEDVYAAETDTGTGASGNPLPERFREGASFLANKSIYNKIRQFSVGTVGEGSIWQRGIAAGMPNELIGYPAYENSAMDSTIANGNDVLIFGKFNPYFTIVDRVGMSIEVDAHVQDGSGDYTGQRAIIAWWRNGSKILSSNAFRKIRVGEGS